MPIPSTITDLSTLTTSNSPLGSDAVGSPATVDDYFRSHAAIMREQSLRKSWEERGDVPTFVNAAAFSTPGDKRTQYSGRRLTMFGATTTFGTVHSVTYTGATATGIYVTVDGGGVLDASLSVVWVGMDPNSVPVSPIVTSFLPLSGGEMTGPITMSGQDVVAIGVITSIAETDFGNSGASKSISFTDAHNAKVTINQDTVLHMVAPPGIAHFQLRLIQDAVGGHTVSFVGLVATRYIGSASQPAINGAANGETILTLFWNGAFATSVQSLQKVGA